jgi:two-component system sensor histidine kinase HydH
MHDYNHSISPEIGLLVKEAALAAMSAWLAAIANNIKNPVAGIGAAIDILDRDLARIGTEAGINLTSPQETIARIKIRMSLLNEYVTELVDFAKPPNVYPTLIELDPIVEIIKESMADLGVDPTSISSVYASDSRRINADEGRLVLILKSLVLNGIEAIGASKKAKIRIASVRQNYGSVKGILLSVEDNGPGFFENVVTHIFDPFFSTKEASTGLGLTLVKKYVDAHRGTIMISSSSDLGGAKVEMFFPD